MEYESVLIVFSEPIQAGPAFNNIKIVGQDYNGYNSRNININKSISGSSLTLTPDSFWASGDYTVTVPVNSIKNMAGNGLAMVFTSNFRADTTPPTLTATPAGGTYTGGQVVTLTATDNLDPNPSIYYSTYGGIPNMRYTGPISISNTTTLKFRADDTSGNTSFKKVIYTIATDTTPPMVSASPAGGTYSTAQTVTLTATDNLDPNPAIYYTLNGTAPTTSSSRYTGPISVGSSLSLSFMAVDASGNSCPVQTLIYTILPPSSSAVSVYSFEIPTSTLVTIQGSNVKIGVSRIIRVDTPTGYYLFTSGNIDGVTPGSAIELYSGYYNRISNFSISSSFDYITISYYGDLNESVNQVSAIYRQGDYPEYEAVDIVKNGLKQLSINFSMTLPRYDDTEIRYLLYDRYYHQDTGIWPPEEGYLDWNYQQLCHNHPIPSMKFANTGEDVIYNSSLDMITNSPSLEYINSKMTYNNTTINKQETITYNNDPEAGFECMQSFAITNTKVTDSMVQFWLNKKSEYPAGAKKAAYGTFMTALTTLWLSDKLADEMASCLDVTWNRNTPTVVMSGVNSNGAYVHCQDPAMGMCVSGSADNLKFFKFVNSMMLSEVENVVLGSAGLHVNSTVSTIISGILEGKPFITLYDNETNRLMLMLEDNEQFFIIIDLNTGLVLDITNLNNSIYKGAASSENSYCYHDERTDNLCNNTQNSVNTLKEDTTDIHTWVGTAGGLLLVAGCLISGPVGWAVLGVGILSCAYGSGLFDDIYGPNPGYTNEWNWLEFGISLCTAGRGGMVKSAAQPIITNVGKNSVLVSKTPIKQSLTPAKIQYIEKFGNTNIMTRNQYGIKSTFGETDQEAMKTVLIEYGKNLGISKVLNGANNWVETS
ncbi:MAG: hypothetical protein A4E27_00695 [Methanobacterium sp. PtaU1.Bin242]|nr:MAG: hypothetical protein A4E27_00695 [Methanobacterium sp. PtaU1.Bin242]